VQPALAAVLCWCGIHYCAVPPHLPPSQAGCRMLGYNKGELDGKNVSTIMWVCLQGCSGPHFSYLLE